MVARREAAAVRDNEKPATGATLEAARTRSDLVGRTWPRLGNHQRTRLLVPLLPSSADQTSCTTGETNRRRMLMRKGCLLFLKALKSTKGAQKQSWFPVFAEVTGVGCCCSTYEPTRGKRSIRYGGRKDKKGDGGTKRRWNRDIRVLRSSSITGSFFNAVFSFLFSWSRFSRFCCGYWDGQEGGNEDVSDRPAKKVGL